MSDEQSMEKYQARITMNVTDFGPDCTLFINGEQVASLGEFINNGTCETLYKEIEFLGDPDFRSTDIEIQVYRNWKGMNRLAYTRKVRVKDGENELNISYMGVKPVRNESNVVDKYSTVMSSSE